MATINERIELLKEMAADSWNLAYSFLKHYGNESVEYIRQSAQAYAYSDALEIITGCVWYYSSRAGEMLICN